MPRATLTFQRLHQDSQDFGSDNDHMVSRVFFSLQTGERSFPNLHADVKQTVGSDYNTAPLEVSAPTGYDGPMDHDAFRAAAEHYYRGCVGPQLGGQNIRMQNNLYVATWVTQIEIPAAGGAW